ncbi:putative MATE family efflux protein [Rhizobium sp. ERR 922]|uniref:MATE family efflux transporter n=1 Tax=unclassified Rhizobium TaxID=2613769 RepID=UPI0011AAC703|nr:MULTISPECIES: MATE family efflux transporter [unclassified Rhizobium]TWB53100.1 putative MATE family efflux protein [Rhizobium sp. ERR 922]TWB95935.1 putative MATE family efflux protein [Rhizobium sp. ERR 942]
MTMHSLKDALASKGVQKAPSGVLDGSVTFTLLRLALPTVIVLVVQTFVGIAETYFISFLGTEALAGVTLVFPVLMLMQMMANGGIGGGVSSAVARALGANRQDDADALVWHSIVLATVLGAVLSVFAILFGPMLYRSMGGTGATLKAALTYSGMVFAGSIPIWITALLSAALRGAGSVNIPALVIISGAVLLFALSPALIFGWGPFPKLGVAGGGAAIFIYYVLAALSLSLFLRSSGSPLKLNIVPLQRRLFADILSVGLPSAVGTVQVNLTVTFVTAAVGHFGADAIAGFGIASRLDYVQIPIIFGLGTAIVTMVGINIGANQIARARRVTWVGAAIAFGIAQTIGIVAALFPATWMGLFTTDPHVQEMGFVYLRTVAPAYGAVGLGMALYFASQGAKRVRFPVLAGTVRMIVAAFVGWASVIWFGANLHFLFRIVAVAAIAYGVLTAIAVLPRRMFVPVREPHRQPA